MRDKYGPTLFGEQVMVARRLVEAGVPFVKVSRPGGIATAQNFETHLELVSELDHVMSTPARRPFGPRPARPHAGRYALGIRPHAPTSTPAWAATTSPAPGAPRSRAAA